jgi:hypothetical protein
MQHVSAQAAQWGADQELQACINFIYDNGLGGPTLYKDLRTARRPKPPSLRKQAYDALDTYIYGEPDPKDKERTYNTIRRALEQLPDARSRHDHSTID